MRVTPISEEAAASQSSGLWPNGDYDYEVKEAEEKQSAKGNDMIAVQVWLFDATGSRKMVFDYLVEGEKTAWKVRHFAASCGLLTSYEAGELDATEIVGRTGRCVVGTQPAKDGYEAKNVIRDYVKVDGAAAAAKPAAMAKAAPARVKVPAGDLDDEIPF